MWNKQTTRLFVYTYCVVVVPTCLMVVLPTVRLFYPSIIYYSAYCLVVVPTHNMSAGPTAWLVSSIYRMVVLTSIAIWFDPWISSLVKTRAFVVRIDISQSRLFCETFRFTEMLVDSTVAVRNALSPVNKL